MIANISEIRSKLINLISTDNNRIFVVFAAIVITMIIFLIIQSLISRSANLDQKDKNPNLVEYIRKKQELSISFVYHLSTLQHYPNS